MAERLFGMEIEYGCAVRGRDPKRPIRSRDWLGRFMAIACEQLPHLPSMDGGGIFLRNGARFYVDCTHPEMTTPECANPWDVVRYMHSGERMLAAVAAEMMRRERTIAEVLLFKSNVDHSGTGSTWGCHTSFMHRGNPQKFPAQIIPHLVSRIVYSGAGGLELSADGRLLFALSPRVRFLECEVSNNSTAERGIFHTKDETLAANGYHRLHIICGESLCSETALWLNMGATALIVAMIEAGLQPGDAVQLSKPLETMRRFTVDPTCSATGETTRRQKLTAIQIQRHYLELAEAHRDAPFMPPWADRVCVQWRSLLDCLEAGAPGSVATVLDWAMKFSLFLGQAEKRGLNLEHWFHTRPQIRFNSNGNELPLFETGESCDTPNGVSPDVRKVHQELCEIDTRFGQLGNSGIFTSLDRAGVLKHRFAGVDNIEHALANGPAIGRGGLRAHCVSRFSARNHRYLCSWKHIFDQEKNLLLDISDPFASNETWQPAPEGFPGPVGGLSNAVHSLLEQARTNHDGGNHESAAELLCAMEGRQSVVGPALHAEYLRLRAWIQSRRGFLDGIAALDELAQSQPMTLSLVNAYVCAYRYQGMIPPTAIEPWIRRGQEFLSPTPDPSCGAALPFLGHWGYCLLRNGRPEEALRTLQDACQPVRRESSNHGAIARTLADYADACRALGQHANAVAALDEAEALQIDNQLEGDRSDFALTYRAKLETDSARAFELLGEALAIQTRLGNVLGETRSVLLQARLLRKPALASPLKFRLYELRGHRPALVQCRLLAKILDHWDAWINGAADPDGGKDFYWWL